MSLFFLRFSLRAVINSLLCKWNVRLGKWNMDGLDTKEWRPRWTQHTKKSHHDLLWANNTRLNHSSCWLITFWLIRITALCGGGGHTLISSANWDFFMIKKNEKRIKEWKAAATSMLKRFKLARMSSPTIIIRVHMMMDLDTIDRSSLVRILAEKQTTTARIICVQQQQQEKRKKFLFSN